MRRCEKSSDRTGSTRVGGGAANEVWSADFVFDRIASGRMLKCLAIVDDAIHEAFAMIVEHCIGGEHLCDSHRKARQC